MRKILLFRSISIFLLIQICLLFSVHAAPLPTLTHPRDETPLLIYYIMKQSKVDNATVADMVNRLHTLYGIKRVEMVCSTTDANYYLRGGILRMNLSDSNKMCDVWLAELSHAIQFNDQPVKYGLMTMRDGVHTLLGMLFLSEEERAEVKKLRKQKHCSGFKARCWVVWKRNEDKEGTMENIAHLKIQKTLTDYVIRNFYGHLEIIESPYDSL